MTPSASPRQPKDATHPKVNELLHYLQVSSSLAASASAHHSPLQTFNQDLENPFTHLSNSVVTSVVQNGTYPGLTDVRPSR